jgi:hypothetical protein
MTLKCGVPHSVAFEQSAGRVRRYKDLATDVHQGGDAKRSGWLMQVNNDMSMCYRGDCGVSN